MPTRGRPSSPGTSFFFQAEDGIRDLTVTGVQTCALPISGIQSYADTGTLYVYAATDPPNFSKMLKSTLKELREAKKQGVTEDELKRAKDHLKGSLMLSLESTSSRMNRLAKHELHFGSFLTLDQMLSAIDRVKHDEVQALVAELLDE